MEAIKKYAVLGLLAALFVGEVAAMRMSPQQAKLFAARQAASKRGMQMPSKAQPTKTDAVKAQELKELKEAFMSDNDYIAQKTESLNSGEYFVHAKGTTDGVVVKRDVVEKSPVLKSMLEDTTWSKDHASIPLPFSSAMVRLIFDILDLTKDSVTELSSKQLSDIKSCLDYLDIYTIFYDNLVIQKTKKLNEGEYFVYAQGTADGVVVKRDVLEQSPTLKGMLEDTTWSQDNASIPLPFSADDIKLVFQVMNKKVNAAKLPLDQLVGVLNCYNYLLMDMNSTDLINAVVARINDIGDKIMKREVTPDYTVFGNIKDPNVVKIIIDKVLSTPKNFCKKFTDEENYRYGRSDDGNPSDQWNYNPEQDVNQVFRGLTSINAILNKVKDALARWDKISAKYRKEEEDKKKWFWQRW